MDKLGDWALLRKFVDSRSQEAFAELTRQYIGLVLGTALRELGDRTLAEDVTQAVFLILARKAHTFRPNIILAAWLFDTCKFTARHARRDEMRRRIRERKVAMELQQESAAPHATEITDTTLNDALSALSASDRQAVLLRFVCGYSFQETGDAFGISENTARMRVDRALEKLRRSLTKSGFGLSVIGIAELLQAHAANAASPMLATRITDLVFSHSAALAGVSAYAIAQGALKSMIITNLKIAAVVTCGLVLAGGALYQGFAKPSQSRLAAEVRTAADATNQAALPARAIAPTTPSIVGTLPDAYTLTYTRVDKDLETPELRAANVAVLKRNFDNGLYDHRSTKKQAAELLNGIIINAESQHPPVTSTITVSSSHGKYYFRLETAEKWRNVIMIYDGVKTYVQRDPGAGAGMQVWNGLNILDTMPYITPAVNAPPVMLIKDPIPIASSKPGVGKFSGNVCVVNAANWLQGTKDVGAPEYSPGDIETSVEDGRIKVISADTLYRNNHVSSHWDFYKHQLFGHNWIASKMAWTQFTLAGPVYEVDFQLQKATTTPLNDAQFDYKSYLATGQRLTIMRKPNPVQLSYAPREGGLEQQLARVKPADQPASH